MAVPIYLSKGAVLFTERQPAHGVFFLYSGCVKLFTSSPKGKTLILRFAGPQEVLGLGGALSGQAYEAWAEATEPSQAGLVQRKDLMRLMQRHGEMAVHMAMKVSESYRSAVDGMRLVGLPQSASQKLARFLLDWCKRNQALCEETGVRFTLTHEEVGQLTGVSRETVTRVLSEFRRKGLIRWEGYHLVLTDRVALEESAAS
jgi:CRP/FNR family transcriptional regulator